MIVQKKRLGDLLVESGLITEEVLQQTLKEKRSNQKLGDAFIEKGLLTEQQLIEVLEFQLGIPHLSLYRYPIDEQAVAIVPREFARRHFLMPVKKEADKLFVAMADPMDFTVIDDLRLTTGFQIERAISAKDDIIRAHNKYYDIDDSMDEFLDLLPQGASLSDDSRMTEEDSPIVKLVNQIIQQGVQQKASDIHFDPHETKIVIRYRIDGMLKTERSLPKHMQNMLTARIKIMANLNITESRLPQDGRIKMTLDMHPVDLRVSTLPAIYGEKIVLRILDLGSSLNHLENLGFNKLNMQRFTNLIKQPNGIILITGPTGSGKSSTLYAALNKLNTEEVNLVTIEDPVEYQLAGINQIQVNSSVGLTFASGLRSILRQDPDIVMIGEIRDTETAEIAVRASLTGHLVLSTLHTNDSIGTIARLTDMGVEPFLVAASLSGVIAQRLVRRVCRDCKQTFKATEREKEIFAKRGIKIESVSRGKGCGMCNSTGYKGRIALHEVLVVDEHIRQLIMNNRPIVELRDYAMKNGTIFLIDDGFLKVKQGLTTTEEVLRVAINE
ncbi:type II secretion system protein GspE [Fictibacillus phosphorivorans]|uniref:Type II secretion system protein GspE n=1 Tax=Fictibacillus phosphorivorans TaxID=1221500 RepID=A0A168W8S3_9BACL|nr:ATPase, T2SS/T4P/T4SS family [Fictibacillus phosphorivorans]ANC78585.1 type II secretion system protein GspE [Fictibacillus phosphorivorans]